MTTLYLDRKDLSLQLSGQTLVVYCDGHREGTVPVHLLDGVVMHRSVQLDSGVLARLADDGIGIVAFGGRLRNKIALVQGRLHNDGARRLGQCRCHDDPAWQHRWARALVLLKLRRQRRLLLLAREERPDLRHPLTQAAGTIGELIARVRIEREMAASSLRGVEGAAAAAYFRGFCTLFPDSLGFTGRNRRPPRDPVNAVLSLGYTLLHAEAVRACYGAGLDPMIGFYHRLEFGRESLASDLIEPLRPAVDRFAWEQFRTRALTSDDFTQTDGACLLAKAGRGQFFSGFETAAGRMRGILRRATRRLARELAAIGGR